MARKKRRNPTNIRLLSVADIAERYKFHPNTIRGWVHHDGLRCYKAGVKMFIREDDLTDFLISHYAVYAVDDSETEGEDE